jgi:hypothetical protein
MHSDFDDLPLGGAGAPLFRAPAANPGQRVVGSRAFRTNLVLPNATHLYANPRC